MPASKIRKFLTSFMKSVLVYWDRYLLFYQNVFSTGVSQKTGYMYNGCEGVGWGLEGGSQKTKGLNFSGGL